MLSSQISAFGHCSKNTSCRVLRGFSFDLGFMAYDVNEIQNETGGTVEQALDTYRDNLREEGHTWWEVIDPFRFGQQIALDLGIDKLAEKAVDWTMDTFSDSASEKMKKAEKSEKVHKAYYDTSNSSLEETVPNYIKLQEEWKNYFFWGI